VPNPPPPLPPPPLPTRARAQKPRAPQTVAGSTPPAGAGGCPVASASVGIELATGLCSAQASFERIKKTGALSLVRTAGGSFPLTAGMSVGYDGETRTLSGRAVKLAYGMPGHYSVTAFASDLGSGKGGTSYGCLVHSMPSGAAGMQIATEVRFADGRPPLLSAAVSAPLTVAGDGATVKAKAGTDSLLHLSLKQRLSASTTVTFAGCVDLHLNSAKTRLGVHLALAP